MAVIEKNQILAPFLSTKLSYITGQDPMGMLNIGDQVFSMLLPGLTSVTDRIRYYSFYCWLFDWYAKEIGSENPKELYKYVRRAEYLLALIAAKTNVGGIPGITEAKKNYTKQSISLSHGTGEHKDTFDNTYWKDPQGVFGQNYAPSLKVIGIIRDREQNSNLYIRTAFDKENVVSGKELALAFINNIEIYPNAHQVFLKAITTSTVTQEELELLEDSFNMKKVPVSTEENQLLLKMLLGNDLPLQDGSSTFRNKTTLHYLQLLHNKKSRLTVLDFVQFAYENQGYLNGVEDETLTAWYYYQLSQYWHIVNTGGLKHLLKALQEKSDGSWYVENDLIEELTEAIVTEFIKSYNCTSTQAFHDLPVVTLDNNSISKEVNSSNYINGFCQAFLLLQKIAVENKTQIVRLKEFAKAHHLVSSSDIVAVFDELERLSALPLHKFIAKFIKKYIIDRHQLVAFSRIRGSQTSEKFIREDGLIRFIDYISFGFSNPRLDTLIEFYTELAIISDDKNTLTKEGVALLKTLEAND